MLMTRFVDRGGAEVAGVGASGGGAGAGAGGGAAGQRRGARVAPARPLRPPGPRRRPRCRASRARRLRSPPRLRTRTFQAPHEHKQPRVRVYR